MSTATASIRTVPDTGAAPATTPMIATTPAAAQTSAAAAATTARAELRTELTGLTRLIHRAGAALVAWSEARALDRPSIREVARLERSRSRAHARRDHDAALVVDRMMLTRLR